MSVEAGALAGRDARSDERAGAGRLPVGVLVAVASVGASAAGSGSALNLLPRVVEAVAGPGRVLELGLLLAAGSVAGMVASVIAGVLSDRMGRRGPWILAGAAVLGAGLAALPAQRSLTGVAAAWVILHIGLGVALVGVAALVPDHVPRLRLGRVSALAAVGQVVGAVVGIGVMAAPGTSLRADGVLVAATAVLLLSPAGLVRGGASVPVRPAPDAASTPATSVDTSGYRDFWLVWMTRLTVAMSNVMVMTYLLYYLTEVVRHPHPVRAHFVIVVVASACFTVTALASGWLSDRFQRRKALVAASMVVLAAAEVVLTTWASWPGVVAGAVIFGSGYGIYLAIDQALMNDVLPRRGRTARDLGVFNVAGALPLITGPLVAAQLVASAGFAGMYAAAAVSTFCGLAFVAPIRGVR